MSKTMDYHNLPLLLGASKKAIELLESQAAEIERLRGQLADAERQRDQAVELLREGGFNPRERDDDYHLRRDAFLADIDGS